MAGKVFFSVSMPVDGFIVPESIDDVMGPKWMELPTHLTYAVRETAAPHVT